MRRIIARALMSAVLAGGALAGVPAVASAAADHPVAVRHFDDPCVAGDNLGEIANNFISRCRQGSIRQVFPGEHYGDTLGEIKACGLASCRTAWKLLNDNRFKK